MYTTTLNRVGDAVMLTVPSAILDLLHLQAGEKVEFSVDDNRLLIHSQGRPRYKLDDLLAECDPSAEPTEEDRHWLDGGPVGNELL
uniref:Antitoxin ChpS n=1 Tax=Candidatus Kentrum sp. FM TaxID=2126340 RepID=A0A450S173_9GAMM|nr:MAG: antitoxin ChpS [Candidatus Kentron sp. FM]VFJ57908.1 MAG: antitoxin ChpS [Candidatus Kentron sp. FM]VFK16586.1 MAG: antitoxin ChpS [Candidatus Kentron sp. FM]